MSEVIKFNETELKQHAESMNQTYIQMVVINDNLNDLFDSLNAYWQGNSFDSFKIETDKMKESQRIAMENLLISVDKLKQVAGVYEHATSEVTQRNEGLPIEGVFSN